MAKPHVIKCSDCGAPRLTRWKNTKYCFLCRLIRNLEFVGDKQSKCIVCDQAFAPLKRGDDLCGHCDTIPLFEDCVGKCAFCKEDDQPLVGPEIAICIGCAKDGKIRKNVRKALLIRRQRIMSGFIKVPEPTIPTKKAKKKEEPAPQIVI